MKSARYENQIKASTQKSGRTEAALRARKPRAGAALRTPAAQGGKDRLDVLFKLMESFAHTLMGKRIRLAPQAKGERPGEENIAPQDARPESAALRDGWELVYESHDIVLEEDAIHVSSEGSVQIPEEGAVGFELDMNLFPGLNLSLLHETSEREKERYRAGGPAPAKKSRAQAPREKAMGALGKNGLVRLRAYDLDMQRWVGDLDRMWGELSILFLGEDRERALIRLGRFAQGSVRLKAAPGFWDQRR